MTLEDLKNQIESGNIPSGLLIFKLEDNDFVARQYITEIAKLSNREIEYLSEIDSLLQDTFSLFESDMEDPSTIRVYITDEFTCVNTKLLEEKFLIVIAGKITDESSEMFKSHMVTMPKLLEWQIKDYVYSTAEGVPTQDLDWLISLYGKDIYRLEQELSKFKLFDINERKYLFSDLKQDGAYTDVSAYNIFNLTNALTTKNLSALSAVYHELDKVDVNEFGLLTILLKNFKNIMMVQLQSNTTPENTLMESKQLYAIKKLPRVFTGEQLVKIFTFLSSLDKLVKIGELPTDIMIDYIIIKILSA